MSLLFLLPLGVAIAAFFMFERSEDELAVLLAVVALTGLVFSLILAPWQVQLAVLILALLRSQSAVRSRINGLEFENHDNLVSTLYSRSTNRQNPW